jgi:hypothetical protein
MGLVLFAAVRRYRNGAGLASSILWFFWTQIWLGVVAALVRMGPLGTAPGILVYAAFAAVQINAVVQNKRADEFFTTQYGSLTRYKVTYMGGHPDYREFGAKGVLLITQAGLLLVQKYRAGARTLCMIPLDRIQRVDSLGTANRVTAWTTDMPFPMTFTASEQGTMVVQFTNDLSGTSVAGFRVGSGTLAAQIKNQVDYAVYDWWRAGTGGLQST